MKHMAVYHLTNTVWLTELVADKDLLFNPTKLFMVPGSEQNLPTWRSYTFYPRESKMYRGDAEPYSVHHYYLDDPLTNLTEDLSTLVTNEEHKN